MSFTLDRSNKTHPTNVLGQASTTLSRLALHGGNLISFFSDAPMATEVHLKS